MEKIAYMEVVILELFLGSLKGLQYTRPRIPIILQNRQEGSTCHFTIVMECMNCTDIGLVEMTLGKKHAS